MIEMDINTLVRKQLTGEITPEEQERLQCRLEADADLRRRYEAFCERTDMVDCYRRYAAVDSDGAKQTFRIRHHSSGDSGLFSARQRSVRRWVVSGVAVAALAFVAFTAFNALRNDVAAPRISAEIAQAMEKVEKLGKTDATIIVKGRGRQQLANAAALQAYVAQVTEDAGAKDRDGKSLEATVVTHHDKEFWMTLDDGTCVHINYGSSLSYPLRFDGKERVVELRGEAYFFVAHDSRRPFIVKTPQGEVRDLGTEFNVNTRSEINTTEVVLVQGKVAVSSSGKPEVRLSPNQRAVMQAGGHVVVSEVDVSSYVAWNTGNFHFDDCSLEDLMNVIAHWYHVEVEFVGDSPRHAQFTGNLDKYESIGPTLHAVSMVTGCRIEVEGRKVVIR